MRVLNLNSCASSTALTVNLLSTKHKDLKHECLSYSKLFSSAKRGHALKSVEWRKTKCDLLGARADRRHSYCIRNKHLNSKVWVCTITAGKVTLQGCQVNKTCIWTVKYDSAQ